MTPLDHRHLVALRAVIDGATSSHAVAEYSPGISHPSHAARLLAVLAERGLVRLQPTGAHGAHCWRPTPAGSRLIDSQGDTR